VLRRFCGCPPAERQMSDALNLWRLVAAKVMDIYTRGKHDARFCANLDPSAATQFRFRWGSSGLCADPFTRLSSALRLSAASIPS
jgi:hypothetical protein